MYKCGSRTNTYIFVFDKYTPSDIQYIGTTIKLCPFKLYLRISSGIQEMFRRDPSQL